MGERRTAGIALAQKFSCKKGEEFVMLFNGLEMNLGNLFRVSNAKSRSVSPENYTGEKGKTNY